MNDRQVTIFHQLLCKAGGMEHYAIELVKAFTELEFEVHYFCRRADMDLADSLGVRVHLSGSHSLIRQWRDWSFYRAVKNESARVPWFQIGLSRAPARDLSICGGTHLGYLRQSRARSSPLDSLLVHLEKKSYAAARKVVSHSVLCRKELAQLYRLPEEKIVTLFPPISAKFQAKDSRHARIKLGLPENKTVFLFPSTGHRRKGFHLIAEVFPQFADRAVLAIAGNQPPMSAPWLHPLGYIDSMETAYSAADFTILASLYEPFGLVGPESVLCGTPLVFDASIGCLDALDKKAVIPFDLWQPHTLVNALEKALNLREQGRHRLENGSSFLTYNPDPVLHAKQLLELGRLG